jgi:hypothetical protein
MVGRATDLLHRSIVEALAAREVARAVKFRFADTASVVNRFAVNTSARLFPSIVSEHRRILARTQLPSRSGSRRQHHDENI